MEKKSITGSMNKKQRIRAALAGEPVDRTPVSLWGHDYLRESSPEDLVAATLEEYRTHNWDFIKLNPRSSYFAEAWGNTYGQPTDSASGRQTNTAVNSLTDLSNLSPADPHSGVFREHLEALNEVLEAVGNEVDVVHTIFSPLSVIASLCGPPEHFLKYAATDPAAAHHALTAVTSTLNCYAEAALGLGVSGIFFAPLAWASHNTCDAPFYREFGRPYDLQLLNNIRHADFNILHVCRDDNMIDLLLDYPVAAVNWSIHGENNPSLQTVTNTTDIAVMGGIDHAHIHEMSTVEITAQAVAAMYDVPERLILTAGCSIPPSTPDTNRAAVAAATRENIRS